MGVERGREEDDDQEEKRGERETKVDGHRSLQVLVHSRGRKIGEQRSKYKMSQC